MIGGCVDDDGAADVQQVSETDFGVGFVFHVEAEVPEVLLFMGGSDAVCESV